MNRILFYFIIVITLCSLFFQDMLIVIAKQPLYIAPIMLICLILLSILKNYKKTLLKLKQMYKYTSFKYLVYFVLWCIVSSLLLGFSVFLKCSLRIFLIFVLAVIPAIMFACQIFPRFFSYKKLFTVFLGIYYFILIYGIFDYGLQLLNSDVANNIHNIFNTRRLFSQNLQTNTWALWSAQWGTLVRARSVFFEASFFATFLFLFMPFVYKIADSKIIFMKKHKLLNRRKTLLVALMWLNLFLTQSPMYIFAGIVYTFIYYLKRINTFFIKNISVILCIILTIFITIYIYNTDINISNNRLATRIINTCTSFGSIDKLVLKEPSLATRVLLNIQGFNIGCKKLLTGTGYGNAAQNMYKELYATKMPLTDEITMVCLMSDGAEAPPAIFFAIFCQTGIVGIILLYLYFIKSIIQTQKISKYFYGKEQLLCESLVLIAINYIIISFYWSLDKYPFMWFIFGLLNSYILYYKFNVKKQYLLMKQNNKAGDEE